MQIFKDQLAIIRLSWVKNRRFMVRIIFFLFSLICFSACADKAFLHPDFAKYRFEKGYVPKFKVQQHRSYLHIRSDNSQKIKTSRDIHADLYSNDGDKGVVIVGGGNAQSRAEVSFYYRFLMDNGFRVLFYSLPGFDESESSSKLKYLIEDANLVFDYVSSNFPGEPIFFLGHSISSISALCLESHSPVLKGVIVESALIPDKLPVQLAQRSWAFPILLPIALSVQLSLPENFTLEACRQRKNRPRALFVHNPQDRVTPLEGAVELFLEYNGEKEFYYSAAASEPSFHQSAWSDLNVQRRILKFIFETR